MTDAAARPPRLLLASRSPRRVALLRDAGFRFDQADPPFDDPPQPEANTDQSPGQLAAALAEAKAQSVVASLDKTGGAVVVLAADTICVGAGGELIGKPRDRDDARATIRSFMNADHAVVSGVALVREDGSAETFADTATIRFGAVSDDQLAAYLETDAWRDKAGGYNLADRQSAGWPLTVTGDPGTVIGLPMRKLGPALARLGVTPTRPDAADLS